MMVLKATQAQYDALNGFTNGADRLEFTKDAFGNWVVGVQVRHAAAFDVISGQLEKLEEIEFVALPPEAE